MKNFSLLMFSAVLSLFSLGVYADLNKDDFKAEALSVFSLTAMQAMTVNEKSGTASLTFKQNPAYLGSYDKANSIHAIDSIKFFINLPDLKQLSLIVPLNGKTRTLTITAAELEAYYKISIDEIRSKPHFWKRNFLTPYDTVEERAKFVQHFVKIQ